MKHVSCLMALAAFMIAGLGCQKAGNTHVPAPPQQSGGSGAGFGPTSGFTPNTTAPQSPTSAPPETPSAFKGPKVDAAKNGPQLQVPFILWGAEAATFWANGGLETTEGSTFGRIGLNFNFVQRDNFEEQVREYLAGTSFFLRGTFSMLALYAEKLNASPDTQPIVFLKLSDSNGDHLVVRSGVKTIADLKGKTITLQKGGPHVGMLDGILRDAGLTWKDITAVWVTDITGVNGPAERFRKDGLVTAAFAVTPDMISLTGGSDKVGTGAEGTVQGARVLVSTKEKPYSVVDVYAVRSDFYKKNPELVAKFAAGWLKGVEQVIDLRAQKSPQYRELLNYLVQVFGTGAVPNADEADGLVADCQFVGHPGNVAFFTDATYGYRFDVAHEQGIALGIALGYGTKPTKLLPSPLKWHEAPFAGYLTKLEAPKGERFKAEAVASEIQALQASGGLEPNTVYAFTIGFGPDQYSFPVEKYGHDFEAAVKKAKEYPGAVLAVRGHTDPTATLAALVRACAQRGVLQTTGDAANRKYALGGKPLDIARTNEVQQVIASGACDGTPHNPREVLRVAFELSKRRAEEVRNALIGFARAKGVTLDQSQLQAQGAGIGEPFIAVPRSEDDAAQNRRVEFRLIRVSAEAVNASDFNY